MSQLAKSTRLAVGLSTAAVALLALSLPSTAQTFRDGRSSPIQRSLGQAAPAPARTDGPQILPPAGLPAQTAQSAPAPTLTAPATPAPQPTAQPLPLPPPVAGPAQSAPVPVGPVREAVTQGQPVADPTLTPGTQVPTSTTVTADGMPEPQTPGAPAEPPVAGAGPGTKKVVPGGKFVEGPGKRVFVSPGHQPSYHGQRFHNGQGWHGQGWAYSGRGYGHSYGHGHGGYVRQGYGHGYGHGYGYGGRH